MLDRSHITKNFAFSAQIDPHSTNNSPIGGWICEKAQEYAEAAARIQQDRCGNSPEPIEGFDGNESGFHPVDVWNEVPSTQDKYFERKERLFSGGWANQEVFTTLYNGNYRQYTQLQAESYLAAQFAFAFGKSKRIVVFEMDNLPFDTEFESNPQHRSYVQNVVEDIPFVYCEGIDLVTKYNVANILQTKQYYTTSELSNFFDMSSRHMNNVLNVLESEGVVVREQSNKENKPDRWSDNGITDNYFQDLIKDKQRLEG